MENQEVKEIKPISHLTLVPSPPVDPVVLRNIERWRREQEAKKEKRDARFGKIKLALKARFNRDPKAWEIKKALYAATSEHRAKWLLQNCRATLAEIVTAHKEEASK